MFKGVLPEGRMATAVQRRMGAWALAANVHWRSATAVCRAEPCRKIYVKRNRQQMAAPVRAGAKTPAQIGGPLMTRNPKLKSAVVEMLPSNETVSDLQLLRRSARTASENSLAAQRQVATNSFALSPPPDIEAAQQLALEEHRCWMRYLRALNTRMQQFEAGKFG
jgi:hypothetical protein